MLPLFRVEILLAGNEDNVTLAYTGSFPNEWPLIPLKIGDFDAVAISATSLAVLEAANDPSFISLCTSQ